MIIASAELENRIHQIKREGEKRMKKKPYLLMNYYLESRGNFFSRGQREKGMRERIDREEIEP